MVKVELKLKEIREEKNISIRKLALMSNVSKSQISDIENDKSIPTIQVLCQLAVALKVDANELFEIVSTKN